MIRHYGFYLKRMIRHHVIHPTMCMSYVRNRTLTVTAVSLLKVCKISRAHDATLSLYFKVLFILHFIFALLWVAFPNCSKLVLKKIALWYCNSKYQIIIIIRSWKEIVSSATTKLNSFKLEMHGSFKLEVHGVRDTNPSNTYFVETWTVLLPKIQNVLIPEIQTISKLLHQIKKDVSKLLQLRSSLLGQVPTT